jgi:hypothetical protein
MKPYRFLLCGLVLGTLLTAVALRINPFTHSRITPPAQAVEGTLTITGSSQTISGDVTAARIVDSANSAYFIDPAASGTSLYTAGDATISGQFTAANRFTFKSISATELGLYDSTNALVVSFDEGQ